MFGKLLRHFQETMSLISVAPCKAFAGNDLCNSIDSVFMVSLSIQVRSGQALAILGEVLRQSHVNSFTKFVRTRQSLCRQWL
ncbi:MAG: hypothetical protein KIG98_02415 [Comamonas sp.]|nr:hypothetical protein [Comamonas sp.]